MTDTREPEDDFRLFFFPQFFPQKPFSGRSTMASNPTAEGIVFDLSYCSDFTNAAAMDRRLRTIAGEGATNCGDVEAGTSSRAVDKCVKNAFTTKKTSMARYEVHEADEDVSIGIASDGQGDVYAVAFDDAGVSIRGLVTYPKG